MPAHFTHHTLERHNFTLHYVSSGNKNKQPILFIHGVLSNWTNYQDIMEDSYMQENYFMISVDRLGWGKSLIQNKNSETRIATHSDAIKDILKNLAKEGYPKALVVGHSFGGSIATHLCITNPELVVGLVTISAPFNPDLAEPHWYTKLGNMLMIKITLPKHLIRANDEALHIEYELSCLQPDLQKLNVPVLVMHGSDDKVVDYQHSQYAKQQFTYLASKYQELTIQGGKHFILRENKADIIQGLREFTLL